MLAEIINLKKYSEDSESINKKISSSIKQILKSPKKDLDSGNVKTKLVELKKLDKERYMLKSKISENDDIIKSLENISDPNSLKYKFNTLHTELKEQFESYYKKQKESIDSKLQQLDELLADSPTINFKNIKSLDELTKYINSIKDEKLKTAAEKALSACEILAADVISNKYVFKCFSNFEIHTGIHRETSFIKKYGKSATDAKDRLAKLSAVISTYSPPINFKNIKSLDKLTEYINSVKDEKLKTAAQEALIACKILADKVTSKSFDDYVLKCFSDFKIQTGIHRETSFIKEYRKSATDAKDRLAELSAAISTYDKSVSERKTQKENLEKDLKILSTASNISTKYTGDDPIIICYREVFDIFNDKITSSSEAEKILNPFCCEQLKIDSSSKNVILSNVIDIGKVKEENNKLKEKLEKTSKQIEEKSKKFYKFQPLNIKEHMELMELVSPVENLLFQKKSILDNTKKSLSSIISSAEEFERNVSSAIKAQHDEKIAI